MDVRLNLNALATATAAALLIASTPAHAELHRGLWFWGSTDVPAPIDGDPDVPSPYGSIDVVGDPIAESESIGFFNTHGVKRIYGSYQNRPVSEPAVIANWNSQLEAAGIQSQLLLDGTAVNDPAWMADLLVKIDNRLINFNNALGGDEASKFKALHLDLEPQGLALWDLPDDKRDLLDDLLVAYQDIRAHLDAAGFTTMPIYVDIPFFYDKIWDGSEGVGWAGPADRDTWYAAVSAVVDGISIMTFSKNTFSSIDTATSYERGGAMLGKARVGIQPKLGTGSIWADYVTFNGVMNQLEDNYGPTGATDIENYGFWRHALTPPTITAADATAVDAELTTSGGGTGSGGVIIFTGVPGYIYKVRGSHDLRQWTDLHEISTMESARTTQVRLPVSTQERRGFFKVERHHPATTGRRSSSHL